MSRIRSKDKGPEPDIRKELFALGFRYRLHVKDLPGTPDIVLPKYGTVVVDGCFWHGHRNGKVFHLPKTRRFFWKSKIEKIAFEMKKTDECPLNWDGES